MASKPLKQLQNRIGYTFREQATLELALRHRSMGSKNNERLEFLGDSVLGFVVASELYQRFPQASEGQMSRMRAHLVKGKTLAKLAHELEIGTCLVLGSGELKSGGHRRDSILADTVEAILGGVYLEAGIDTCRELVLRWYAERIDRVSPDTIDKDPKTRLQEWLQARQLALPDYAIISTTGADHDQTFEVSCTITLKHNETMRAVEKSNSRRRAEQKAADDILSQLDTSHG